MTQRSKAPVARPWPTGRALAGAAAAVAAAVLASAVHAAPKTAGQTRTDASAHTGADVAEALKRAYLACDRASVAGPMDTGEVWRCSAIYEALKQRVFDGDFERLRAWSKRQPSR